MSKVRFLLSTGITRFHRYYEPLRSPRQPSLALARCRLVPIFRFYCWGFPCSVCLPIHACRRHYHDRPNGPKSLVIFRQLRPSPCFGRVGICIDCCLLSVYSRYNLHVHRAAKRPFTPKAPTTSLPPSSLRLLPGGAIQFLGGSIPH